MILKISLQPLGNIYFGGENRFNEPGEDDNRRATYLLHSRHFPQQTGMLGLIRNQLLLQNGLLADNTARMSAANKTLARVLIGKHNFRTGYTGQYGVIRSISPVYLEATDGELCGPAPLDDVPMKSPGDEPDKHMVFCLKDQVPLMKHYSEKQGLEPVVQHPKKGNASLDQLFLSDKRVGVAKAAKPWGNEVRSEEDESGFFYQTYLSFRPEGHTIQDEKAPFAVNRYICFVQLADRHAENLENDGHEEVIYTWGETRSSPEQPARSYALESALVEFGGERSSYWMEVEPLPDDQDQPGFPAPEVQYKHTTLEAPLKDEILRLVCLSPSWVDMEELNKLSHLVISQSLSFRFLKSKVDETENYQAIHQKNGKQRPGANLESKRFELIDRGSVVYFDGSKQAQIEDLFDQADFQHIGYNKYQIL